MKIKNYESEKFNAQLINSAVDTNYRENAARNYN